MKLISNNDIYIFILQKSTAQLFPRTMWLNCVARDSCLALLLPQCVGNATVVLFFFFLFCARNAVV